MLSVVRLPTTFFALTALFNTANAQTWCGKNYIASSPIVPPGGQFPIPTTSTSPLLAFRCAPAIRPYLPEDVSQPAGILIDTPVTHSEIAGAVPLALPSSHSLSSLSSLSLAVTVSHSGRTLATGRVPLNASKAELSFSLAALGEPQKEAFDVTCSATLEVPGMPTQKFTAGAAVSFLPNPPSGRSVTKMDLRTRALLAKPATGEEGPYQTVLPMGFYTDFGGFLDSNLSIVNEIKAQG